MNLNEFNSLIDLYFYQAKKQNPQSIFLEWLNPQNKKNILLVSFDPLQYEEMLMEFKKKYINFLLLNLR